MSKNEFKDSLGNNPFIQSYYAELVSMSKLKYNVDVLNNEQEERIQVLISELQAKISDVPTLVSNSVTGIKLQVPLVETMNSLETVENGIFSYEGTVFNRTESPISKLLDNMLKDRNVFKDKMLKAKASGDASMAVVFDNTQKVKKEIANSLYGVLGLKQFFLFNKDIAQSITVNCSYQLQQLITQGEKVFSNRVILRNNNELFDFLLFNTNIDNIFNYSKFNFNTDDINEINIIISEFFKPGTELLTEEDISNKIKSYLKFDIDERTKDLINKFIPLIISNKFLLYRFTYLNDINKFLSDTDYLTNFLTENQDNILSLDKFNEKEFIKELSKIFSPLLSILVFDSSTQENQDDLCNNYTRQIVLMSDKL